jgi:hypothetical protein
MTWPIARNIFCNLLKTEKHEIKTNITKILKRRNKTWDKNKRHLRIRRIHTPVHLLNLKKEFEEHLHKGMKILLFRKIPNWLINGKTLTQTPLIESSSSPILGMFRFPLSSSFHKLYFQMLSSANLFTIGRVASSAFIGHWSAVEQQEKTSLIRKITFHWQGVISRSIWTNI